MMNAAKAIRGYVSDCVWVLLRSGCGSCCCCGPAGSRWRSNWGASPTSPSLSLLSFSRCLRRQSSRIPCAAGEASSSSSAGPLYCAARSSGRRDSALEAWILPSASPTSLPCRSSSPCEPPVLACSPSLTQRRSRAGCSVLAGMHSCTRGRYGGGLPLSGSCSRWTGWTRAGHRLSPCPSLCGTTGSPRAGLWGAG